MSKRVCLVVHRAFPFSGGSEAFVHWMAKEFVHRGYETWVLTDLHQGDRDGVHITSDRTILDTQRFDLVVVHGGNCSTQDYLHSKKWPFPVLYLIILPSESPICLKGLENASHIGWSTEQDLSYVMWHGCKDKLTYVRHGIPADKLPPFTDYFKLEYGLENKRVVLSVGGFWEHKGFRELAEVFNEVKPKDLVLCLIGYAFPEKAPMETKWVRTFYGFTSEQVYGAMADASLYVMNSKEEGFGLVLLEAMLFGVPWAARPVGGVVCDDMYGRGLVYGGDGEEEDNGRGHLMQIIRDLDKGKLEYPSITDNLDYVRRERSIKNTVNDIERGMGWV